MLKQCKGDLSGLSIPCCINEDVHLIGASNSLVKKQLDFSKMDMTAVDQLIERTRIFHIFAVPHIKSH